MPKLSGGIDRERTDGAFVDERARAEAAEAEKAEIEGAGREVVKGERDEANQSLAWVRDAADEKLDAATARIHTDAAVMSERKLEDDLIGELCARADGCPRRTSEVSADALARLILVEREHADQHLLTERACSDTAVANRDAFLGMVTHDLRDLLSGIVLSARLIHQLAGEQQHKQVSLLEAQRIQRSVGRMNRMIADLLDVTSIDAGRLAVSPIVSDAAVAVREAVESWIPIAAARSVELRVIDLGRLEAKFDPERVLQIIGNLIANAVKFSPAGATVSIGVERLESEARFWVQDHGPGIPENMLELIFERFWQRRTCDRRGLGLGLYISRCLVAAHSGRIWAQSTLGAGTTVLFTVPTA